RTEVFVDAAFAFAVTMLVISIDQIPTNVSELIEVSKSIPAFAASVAVLMWIWYTHSVWSRRFGLEDTTTVVISVILIILILVFIYPLKILATGFFSWLTDGYLPAQFYMTSFNDLRIMFLYFAVGFSSIFLLFIWMTKHALNNREPLRLTPFEIYEQQTYVYIRWGLVAIGAVASFVPFLLPESRVPLAGFVYSLIGIMYFLVDRARLKNRPEE
ncbi:MAG: TMEM175 family protein, partial [Pseudohongiellaceae bacterium]